VHNDHFLIERHERKLLRAKINEFHYDLINGVNFNSIKTGDAAARCRTMIWACKAFISQSINEKQ
jgi:hypothetical protein